MYLPRHSSMKHMLTHACLSNDRATRGRTVTLEEADMGNYLVLQSEGPNNVTFGCACWCRQLRLFKRSRLKAHGRLCSHSLSFSIARDHIQEPFRMSESLWRRTSLLLWRCLPRLLRLVILIVVCPCQHWFVIL